MSVAAYMLTAKIHFYPLYMSITTNNYQSLSCYMVVKVINASTGMPKEDAEIDVLV